MTDNYDMLLYKLGKCIKQNPDFNPTKPVEFFVPYGDGGLKYLEISFKVFDEEMAYARKVMQS